MPTVRVVGFTPRLKAGVSAFDSFSRELTATELCDRPDACRTHPQTQRVTLVVSTVTVPRRSRR